jgi:hypothetical protein
MVTSSITRHADDNTSEQALWTAMLLKLLQSNDLRRNRVGASIVHEVTMRGRDEFLLL